MPLIVIFVFILIVGSVCGAWLVMTRYARSADAAKFRARLMPQSNDIGDKRTARVALFEKEEQTGKSLVPRLMERFNLRVKLALIAEQAGTKIDPRKFVQLTLVSFLAGYGAAWLTLPVKWRLLGFVFAGLAGWVPLMSLLRKRTKRLHAFEGLFPDA